MREPCLDCSERLGGWKRDRRRDGLKRLVPTIRAEELRDEKKRGS
jgi:hypothetical protein